MTLMHPEMGRRSEWDPQDRTRQPDFVEQPMYFGKSLHEKLFRRFLLSIVPVIRKGLILLPGVRAVTNIDLLVRDPKLNTKTVNLNVALGTRVVVFTVPVGKRWILRFWARGTTTVATQAHLYDGTTEVNIENSTTTGSYNFVPVDLPLEQGWTIQLKGTNDAGDAARAMDIIYEEEDSHLL